MIRTDQLVLPELHSYRSVLWVQHPAPDVDGVLQFTGAITENGQITRAAIHHVRRDIPVPESIRGGIHRQLVTLFALSQGIFGFLPVAGHGHHLYHPPQQVHLPDVDLVLLGNIDQTDAADDLARQHKGGAKNLANTQLIEQGGTVQITDLLHISTAQHINLVMFDFAKGTGKIMIKQRLIPRHVKDCTTCPVVLNLPPEDPGNNTHSLSLEIAAQLTDQVFIGLVQRLIHKVSGDIAEQAIQLRMDAQPLLGLLPVADLHGQTTIPVNDHDQNHQHQHQSDKYLFVGSPPHVAVILQPGALNQLPVLGRDTGHRLGENRGQLRDVITGGNTESVIETCLTDNMQIGDLQLLYGVAGRCQIGNHGIQAPPGNLLQALGHIVYRHKVNGGVHLP